MMLSRLFEPITIGSLELQNRIVMAPMATQYSLEIGMLTEREIAYFSERAKGGVSLIIVGAVCVDEELGLTAPAQLSLDGDRYILGFNDLANEVHAYGTRLAVQLHHAGRQVSTLKVIKGRQPVSPSDNPCPFMEGIMARALTVDEIHLIIKKYVDAAFRAYKAGVDAVEIQAAHGSTIVSEFLSPLTNKRTDEYGESLDGRMRLALEILQGIKERVGNDFPVIYRLSGDEFLPGGITIEETKIIAKKLEDAGADALHISAGNNSFPESAPFVYPPMAMPQGCYVHLAEAVKKTVSIPVITVGRITDPLLAEKILEEGKADLVAMGRALIADPELPKKVAEQRFDDIRRCIGCLQDCGSPGSLYSRLRCSVNATVGRERELKITKADGSKKVLVIGGGPGGMEAARVLAMRGHEVTLFEAKAVLGGQLSLAVKIPHKAEMVNLLNYLSKQLDKLNVKIVLRKKAEVDDVLNFEPDAVVIATGASPLIPNIPGIDKAHVITAWQVLEQYPNINIGSRVVIAGGGSVGCEVATLIADKGKKVIIVEMLDDVARDIPYSAKFFLLRTLQEKGVQILTRNKVCEILDGSVKTVNSQQEYKTLECDTVVLALGAVSNRTIISSLREKISQLYTIGDCVKPRRILEAIHEGYRIGLLI